MRRIMSFFAGSIFGALVGVVTALLLAPSSGEDLQQNIRVRADQMTEEIRDAYESRMVQLETELATLRKPPEPEPTEE